MSSRPHVRFTMNRLALLIVAAAFAGCRPSAPESTSASRSHVPAVLAAQRSESGKLQVFVSIPPEKYFVDRIGGEYVHVTVLLPPGQSPATYEPSPLELARLSSAKVLFTIGVPFEEQVVSKIKSSMPDLNVVNTAKGIELLHMDAHDHAHDHDHEEGELDPHVWMSPRLVKVLAKNILNTLVELAPEHRAMFQANYDAFVRDLDQVDARIAADLAPLKGGTFYVYHPAFGYFAQAYGLHQVAIEAGGRQPTARQLSKLIDRAKAAGVKLIFVQPQFDAGNAELVARQIGGAVVRLDPLAEDYLDNLQRVAQRIEEALGQPPTAQDGKP